MYLLPRSGRFFAQDRNRGQKRHNQIYDSTGTRALRVLAAGMMAGMTSPARPWFRLITPDPDMMKNHNVKVWCDDVTKLILDIFQKGNTYRALHSIYEELGAFGTAASVILDDYQDVVRHYPLTTGEYAIATNWRGEVCTIYREFQVTVSQMVKEFGAEKVTPAVKSMFDRGQLDNWITVIHAIEPREDRDTTKKDAKNKAWRSVYFELNADQNHLLRESGFDRFPALCPRWAATGGDIYGNSPGMEALGDVKQLQHEQLRKANAIDYQTNPPLQVPSSLKNRDVERLPGGITYVDNTGQTSGIQTAFEVKLDLNHLLMDIQDVRQRINSCFFADLFLMLSQQPADGRMTATEVAERHEEKLLMLGPVLERLNNELLEPLVDATFARIVQAGICPPPPKELQGMPINIEFVSMLAQAQRAVGTNSIDRLVQGIGMVAQAKPEILDKFDADVYADIYSDMLGVDPALIVPGEKVAVVRQQRAEAQQRQQKLAEANVQAETAAKLGSIQTKSGTSNAVNDVMGQFSGYGSPSPQFVGA